MRFIYAALFMWVMMTTATAQNFGEQVMEVMTEQEVLAEPSPILIKDFEFFNTSPHTAEESIQLHWNTGSYLRDMEEYRIYRQIIPVHAQSDQLEQPETNMFFLSDISGDPISTFGWVLLKTSRKSNLFVDNDIPLAGHRSLGSVYCYRVEASGGGKEARSPVICTRQRGINTPLIQDIKAISSNKIQITWENLSKMELVGFDVSYSRQNSRKRTVRLVGDNHTSFQASGLSPDSRYCLSVKAVDYYGASDSDTKCIKTQQMPKPDPDPDPDPGDLTFDVPLTRQIVSEGYPYYQGRFPTSGPLPSGKLTKMRVDSRWPTLLFVKPGHSTEECNQANAVVPLRSGEELSAADMKTLYGSETPNLPIVFVACTTAQQLYNYLVVKITYEKD